MKRKKRQDKTNKSTRTIVQIFANYLLKLTKPCHCPISIPIPDCVLALLRLAYSLCLARFLALETSAACVGRTPDDLLAPTPSPETFDEDTAAPTEDRTRFPPSLADVAVVSFLARMRASIGNDWGTFPEGEGKSLWEEITAREGKFKRFGRYVEVLFERQSFKKTFDEVSTPRTHEAEL